MTHIKRLIRASAFLAAGLPTAAMASVYNGGGIMAGISAAAGLGLASGNPFYILLNIIRVVLNLMAFVAVITIIIAGIYMIISLGNDDQIEKGKKIIKYTIIGLLVILFSRILVGLITNVLYGAAF